MKKVNKEIPWTDFYDMHSGGGLKEKWGRIYIQAPEKEARIIFYNRFGHNPDRVTCTCCGNDYSVNEHPNLNVATGYERSLNCLATPKDRNGLYKTPKDKWFHEHYYLEPGEEEEAIKRGYIVQGLAYHAGTPQSLTEFLKRKDILVIYADDIKPDERVGEVPEQGYVWKD